MINNHTRPTFKWITQSQTQKLLGCKRTKLWQLRTKGKIAYSKIGRQTMYYWPSIEKLLMKNSTLPNPQNMEGYEK